MGTGFLALAALVMAGPPPAVDDPPRFSSAVEVVARPRLTALEVLARHRAAAVRQADRIPAWIATGRTTLVFQAPGVSAPMTVTAETLVFHGPGIDETEHRDLRLNGASLPLGGDAVPRLPIVEPEPVAAGPLEERAATLYRYRLDGAESVDGRPCYVVSFAPADAGVRLQRGRAWIDEGDFGLVRLDASILGLRGPIVSARQRDDYRRVQAAGEPAWLLARSETQQVYESPNHRTPVDAVLVLRQHEANPASFEARRRAAHASASVLVARTEAGRQYLRRDPPARREGDVSPLRTVAGRASRVWTLAGGFLADPGIDGLLPFAGVGYADLDFLDTGTQLSAFAAGPFVQIAWSAPRRGAILQGRVFASLVEYNDRAFRGGVERHDENLRQRPASLSLEAVRPAGRWRVRAAYDLGRAGLRRGPDTAPAFVVPARPTVHGLRGGVETEAARWALSAWASASWRSSWTEWGLAGDGGSAGKARAFEKAGLGAARSFFLSRRTVARVDATAMAGRGLDRFSRFTFDGLENRLHGSPAATVRFDHGLVARTSLSTSATAGLRADVFVDVAVVRDPSLGAGARTFPGLGAALQAALPAATVLSVEWSYGPEARRPDGRRGAHVWRMTAFKVL